MTQFHSIPSHSSLDGASADVPRAALDLHTYLVQYEGTPAQKANFVRKATAAITTSIQVFSSFVLYPPPKECLIAFVL